MLDPAERPEQASQNVTFVPITMSAAWSIEPLWFRSFPSFTKSGSSFTLPCPIRGEKRQDVREADYALRRRRRRYRGFLSIALATKAIKGTQRFEMLDLLVDPDVPQDLYGMLMRARHRGQDEVTGSAA
ncbi:hypothetical protein [Agrobacterium tumefaciens]|nr:hypothetical protein [Agrobacterium tumefaciens]